jgi:ribosomal protein S3AE
MAKGKAFAAKLAHELTTEGKVICPVCNTEIKKIKLIRSRTSKGNTWAPKYQFVSMCKCNEKDILAGNVNA